MQNAWGQIKRVTATGVQHSERLSQLARHHGRKGLFMRERAKLYKELGELAYHLMEDKKLEHPDLQRSFERLQKNNENIREESRLIENLKDSPNEENA